jgi:hypothetical protein
MYLNTTGKKYNDAEKYIVANNIILDNTVGIYDNIFNIFILHRTIEDIELSDDLKNWNIFGEEKITRGKNKNTQLLNTNISEDEFMFFK